MAEFVVAKKGQLKPGQGMPVSVGGKMIALFNVEGEYYAVDNTCLHKGGPVGEGVLEGTVVTCPWHGWQYDVTTGKNTVPGVDAKLRPYKALVRGEDIVVLV